MNEEKLEYWLKIFTDNKYAFISKNGEKIVFYEVFERLKQLQNNWNELKKWLEDNWQQSQDIWFVKIINKMQELEQGKDD